MNKFNKKEEKEGTMEGWKLWESSKIKEQGIKTDEETSFIRNINSIQKLTGSSMENKIH